MKFNTLTLFFTIATGLCAYAQQDSIPKVNKLDEVVITGQYNPQSVKKSVFQVNVISRSDIDRQAGNNLADLLNQNLNISITPNATTGKSGVKLFGLDAQYFKILVDNVPLIGDEGLGNNIDLTQINLDDVQQIEIVEGSMGVEYGANAVSGIINIITKKGSPYKWEITPYIQEESVGDEYNMNDMGRHIQSLRIGHNFNENWYANATITSNDFKGYLNDRKGISHVENDSLRGFEWNPKKQLNVKSLLAYNLKAHRFFYKFDFFDEKTFRYGADVRTQPHIPTATTDPVADDYVFNTQRFVHTFNGSGRFEKLMNYDVSFAYQKQERGADSHIYHIRTDEKTDRKSNTYESREGLFTKGNFGNFLDNETINFQVGYEISEIRGFSSSLAVADRAPLLVGRDDIRRMLGSYDVFASTEINAGQRLSFRPGIRSMFSSAFNTQAAVSLSTKYLFNKGYEFRAIVGTAPRLPSYDELYTYFVDVNHDVQGNPELNPEQGFSVFFHLNKTFDSKTGVQFQTKFSTWYLDIQDRIELIQRSGETSFRYSNIDSYKTIGASINSSMTYKNLTLNAGITYSGTSKVIDGQANPNDDFLKGMQANLNFSYLIPKWSAVFSAYLKYNGPEYLFVDQRNDANELITVRGKQNDFTFVDATIRKNFIGNKLEVTAGARNLLDITRINTTATGGGSHNAPASDQLMGYGRHYFLKLLYRLNF